MEARFNTTYKIICKTIVLLLEIRYIISLRYDTFPNSLKRQKIVKYKLILTSVLNIGLSIYYTLIGGVVNTKNKSNVFFF